MTNRQNFTLTTLKIAIPVAFGWHNLAVAVNLDGTSANGELQVNSGTYGTIVGFETTEKTPTASANVQISGDISVENIYGVHLNPQSSITSINSAQLSFNEANLTQSGANTGYFASLFISGENKDNIYSDRLNITENRLSFNGTQDNTSGTRYFYSVFSKDYFDFNTAVTTINNIVTINDSNLTSSKNIGSVLFSSGSAPLLEFYNNQVIVDNSSHIGGTIQAAAGRPTENGKIIAENNHVILKGNSSAGNYISAFDDLGGQYANLQANNNTILIENASWNYGGTPGLAAVRAICNTCTSNAEFANNTVTIKNSIVNSPNSKIYAVVSNPIKTNIGSTFQERNNNLLSDNALLVNNSKVNTNIYVSYASLGTGSSSIDSGAINIRNSKLTFDKVDFNGDALVAAYAASRSNSNSITGTSLLIKDSTANVTLNFFANMSFATSGGNSTITDTTIDIVNSNLDVNVFGCNGTSVNDGTSTIANTTVIIRGSSKLKGPFYLLDATAKQVISKNNSFLIKDSADLTNAELWGYTIQSTESPIIENNDVIFSDWQGGKIQALNNFNSIKFDSINWQNNGSVITLMSGPESLNQTKIDSGDRGWILKTETAPLAGESMILIDGSAVASVNEGQTIGLTDGSFENLVHFSLEDRTGIEGLAELSLDDNGSLHMTISDYQVANQTNILTENYAVAAAFLSHGNDLIIDALDTIEIEYFPRKESSVRDALIKSA